MDTTSNLTQTLPQIAAKTLQDHKGFAGLSLFPLFYTAVPAGGYYVLGDDTFLDAPRNLKRSPGSPASRSRIRLADDTYNAEIYTHEEPIGKEEDAKYAKPGAASAAAMRRAQNILLLNHELRTAAIATSADVPSADIAVAWNTANGSPVDDIAVARQQVFEGCGLEANVVVLPRAVFEAVKNNPNIKAAIKISDKDTRWPEMLAALFDVDRVVVARAIVNNANEGQAVDIAEIWGTSVIVAHVDDQPELQDLQSPSFGRTFIVADEQKPEGVEVDTYPDPRIGSNIIRAQQWTAEKLTGAKAGFHLKNAIQ